MVVEQNQPSRRMTATEWIDGVKHLIVLEQDESGCFREIAVMPLEPPCRNEKTAVPKRAAP